MFLSLAVLTRAGLEPFPKLRATRRTSATLALEAMRLLDHAHGRGEGMGDGVAAKELRVLSTTTGWNSRTMRGDCNLHRVSQLCQPLLLCPLVVAL